MKLAIKILLISTLWANLSYAATNYCKDASVRLCALMEDTGTELDRSGNGSDLTETSGTIPRDTSDFKFGLSSRDLEEGDTEYLARADGGSTELGGAEQSATWAFWIKPESLPTGGATLERYIAKYTTGGNQRSYNVGYSDTTDDFICTLSSDGTTIDSAEGATTPVNGTWYHVACVHDAVANTITLYLNGDVDANGVDNPLSWSGGIFNSNAQFGIGANNINATPASYVDGRIDDVIILGRAASEAEIEEMMRCGVTGEDCPGIQEATLQGATFN